MRSRELSTPESRRLSERLGRNSRENRRFLSVEIGPKDFFHGLQEIDAVRQGEMHAPAAAWGVAGSWVNIPGCMRCRRSPDLFSWLECPRCRGDFCREPFQFVAPLRVGRSDLTPPRPDCRTGHLRARPRIDQASKAPASERGAGRCSATDHPICAKPRLLRMARRAAIRGLSGSARRPWQSFGCLRQLAGQEPNSRENSVFSSVQASADVLSAFLRRSRGPSRSDTESANRRFSVRAHM
jgi:hypothetical protein